MSILRTLFAAVLLAAIVPFQAAGEAAPKPTPTNPSGFVIHRGTNLSHWLSQDFGWAPREEWITENDIRFIASLGFDHVRLPVDEIVLWKEDGAPEEAAFALLERALGWCRAAKLRVIVDLHSVRAHHFNAENEGGHNTLWTDPQAQEHFLDLWRQLSARLRHHPVDFLAYEIMNEPTAPDPQDWNKLVARSLAFLRSAEPTRVIVLGANMWQIPQMLPKLEVPAGDKNIILSMHTYAPLLLTHHKADWVDPVIRDYPGPVAYPGPIVDAATYAKLVAAYPKEKYDFLASSTDNWSAARLREEYEPAIARAKELGLQLYCGEFGCLPTVPRAARLAYYRDIVGVFEAAGMAWANWEYKGDFGVAEWHGLKSLDGAPDVQLIDALFQR
ncbi:MAG TPA: cellulase family glycosylhydrolase [Opitutaceae bacterium]|nr:cellulase family glycosylhydrolase [Opitutaceae bacterium]